MDKIEFVFIIIEMVAIFIEISLQIYEIISNKKLEKYIKGKL